MCVPIYRVGDINIIYGNESFEGFMFVCSIT